MPELRFVSGEYDEPTAYALAQALDYEKLDSLMVRLGRVEVVGHPRISQPAIWIYRRDGNRRHCPSESTIRQVCEIVDLFRIPFVVVATGSTELGVMGFYLAGSLEEYNPPVPEEPKEDPFERESRPVDQAAVDRWRRASGDADLIHDE